MSNVAVQKKDNGDAAAVARRDWDPLRMMRDMLRWDPFREMAPVLSAELPSYAPAFEVKETKESFVFKADLPGVKEQDVEVNITGNRLTIAASVRRRRKTRARLSTRTSGLTAASHARSRCPIRPTPTNVKAELKNGELTVVVPKTQAAVAKRIPVATGDKPKA